MPTGFTLCKVYRVAISFNILNEFQENSTESEKRCKNFKRLWLNGDNMAEISCLNRAKDVVFPNRGTTIYSIVLLSYLLGLHGNSCFKNPINVT